MFIGTGDLWARDWLDVVENLAVHVLLGISFIDGCIRGILLSERKVVPWLSQRLAIVSSIPTISSLSVNMTTINVETSPQQATAHGLLDKEEEESFPCRIARLITVHALSHAAVPVTCQELGLMIVENQPDLAQQSLAMTTRGIMDILPGAPFYVLVANMPARAVSVPKCMVVAPTNNDSPCIVHAWADETYGPPQLNHESTMSSTCNTWSSMTSYDEARETPKSGDNIEQPTTIADFSTELCRKISNAVRGTTLKYRKMDGSSDRFENSGTPSDENVVQIV